MTHITFETSDGDKYCIRLASIESLELTRYAGIDVLHIKYASGAYHALKGTIAKQVFQLIIDALDSAVGTTYWPKGE